MKPIDRKVRGFLTFQSIGFCLYERLNCIKLTNLCKKEVGAFAISFVDKNVREMI